MPNGFERTRAVGEAQLEMTAMTAAAVLTLLKEYVHVQSRLLGGESPQAQLEVYQKAEGVLQGNLEGMWAQLGLLELSGPAPKVRIHPPEELGTPQ